MRKNMKKIAFSLAMATGAVSQVVVPLANPIVAMAADLTTDQQAISDALTNGNSMITVVPSVYEYDSWAGIKTERDDYSAAFTIDGSAVTVNSNYAYSSDLVFQLSETTKAKKISFNIAGYKKTSNDILLTINGIDREFELDTVNADGTYSFVLPYEASEIKMALAKDITISDLSVEEVDLTYQFGDNHTAVLSGDTLTISGTGELDTADISLWNPTNHTLGYDYYASSYKVDDDYSGQNTNFVYEQIKNIVIEEGVTGITGTYTPFEYLRSLKSVTLPEGFVRITSDGLFRCCYNLSQVNFPSTLEKIGNFTFQGTGLTKVIIPDGQKIKINQWAFDNIKTLKEIYLGDKVTFFASDVFSGAVNAEKLTINMEDIDQYYNYEQFQNLGLNTTEGTEIVLGESIPETITTIWFENLGKIKSITIPDHVTQIGDITADNPDVVSGVVFNQDTAGEVLISAPALFTNNTTWLGSGITPVIEDTDTETATITADSYVVKVGSTLQLDASVEDESAMYHWVIGNADPNETETVASIDENGLVTGLKAGYAVVALANTNNEILDQKTVVVISSDSYDYDSWISGGGGYVYQSGGTTFLPGGSYGVGFNGYTGGGSSGLSISGTSTSGVSGGSIGGTGGSSGGSSGGSGSEGSGSSGGSGSEGGSGSGSGSEGSGSTGSNQNDMCITGYITPITEMDVTIPLDGFKFHIDENRDLIPTISNLENNSQFPLDVNALNINGSTGTEPNVIAADTYTQYEWDNMNKRNTLANMALYLNGEELYSVFQNDNLDTSKAINIGRLESGFSGTTQLEVTPGAQYGKNFGNKTETLTFVYDLVLEFEVPLA